MYHDSDLIKHWIH